MTPQLALLGCFALFSLSACSHSPELTPQSRLFSNEWRLSHIRQMTFGGINTAAHWSFDGKQLVFQHHGQQNHPPCDQIYRMGWNGSDLQRVSNSQGRATDSSFMPEGLDRVLYSSTFGSAPQCPPKTPEMKPDGHVWPVHNSYQVYTSKLDGSDILPFEPGAPTAYNAETAVCKDGSVIFTSDRDGDLELYRGQIENLGTVTGIRQVTHAIGYDGGASFSPDCKKIAWRASRPRPGRETETYQELLKHGLVKATGLEIWVADADGSHAHQVTRFGALSLAPSFTPDGEHIIFASNPRNGKFDLYWVNTDGTGLQRVTDSGTFENFPAFSPDGKHLVFSSGRQGSQPSETNLFMADWKDLPAPPLDPHDPLAENRFLAEIQIFGAFPQLASVKDWVEGEFKAIPRRDERDYRQKTGTSPHILGVWGNACKKGPPVVIGARLDGDGSGIAALLEIARILRDDKPPKSSCFVFATLTREEEGRAGSARLVSLLRQMNLRPPKALLTLGRVDGMENNTLIAFGSDSAREWHEILEKECSNQHLSCPEEGNGGGGPVPLYASGVPVLHFFTGHQEDHAPREKANATGGIQTAELIAAIARKTASPSLPLHFVKLKISGSH